jgi:DNA-binding protein Fis
MKKLKTKLMQSIVENMEGTHAENFGAIESKKLDEDRRLIDELNVKIEEAEDKVLELPQLIKDKNEELMLESMNFCYEKLRVNMQEAGEIAEWIIQVRKDLKKNIIKKQNREINNRQIYSYMHDIFGAEVIDLFDLKYEDVEQKLEKKKETDTKKETENKKELENKKEADKNHSEKAEKAKEPERT